ncbi:uncharacterized protein LOC121859713 isoform X2 [Homarus americanus]|uniref:uncharacterized protein LOC121859713 isoform X2 n=1 Tax=Homarus americanus TaxID=6706 RepID=UPI001C494DD3|nr:uncharacterized protein LOC121859713 isoform X2 [Homarus americanus]
MGTLHYPSSGISNRFGQCEYFLLNLSLQVTLLQLILHDSFHHFQYAYHPLDLSSGSRRQCAAITCRVYAGTHKHLAFYRFPKEPERCNIWVQRLKNDYLRHIPCQKLYNNYRVCSQHFDKSQLKNAKDVHQGINWNAIPNWVGAPTSSVPLDPKQNSRKDYSSSKMPVKRVRRMCRDKAHSSSVPSSPESKRPRRGLDRCYQVIDGNGGKQDDAARKKELKESPLSNIPQGLKGASSDAEDVDILQNNNGIVSSALMEMPTASVMKNAESYETVPKDCEHNPLKLSHCKQNDNTITHTSPGPTPTESVLKNIESNEIVTKDSKLNPLRLSHCERKKKTTSFTSAGPRQAFTNQQEAELVKCFLIADKMFSGITITEFRRLVYKFAYKFNLLHSALWTKMKLASIAWLQAFLKRHPSVTFKDNISAYITRQFTFSSANIDSILSKVSEMMPIDNDNETTAYTKQGVSRSDRVSYDGDRSDNKLEDQDFEIDHNYSVKYEENHIKHQWLYNKTPAVGRQDDELLSKDVSLTKDCENHEESHCKDYNDETVFVLENEYVFLPAQNIIFLQAGETESVKEKNNICISEENLCIKEENACVTEEIFLKEENECIKGEEFFM